MVFLGKKLWIFFLNFFHKSMERVWIVFRIDGIFQNFNDLEQKDNTTLMNAILEELIINALFFVLLVQFQEKKFNGSSCKIDFFSFLSR